MLTIEYVRQKYQQEYGDLTDKEVQEVLDFFYTFGYIMVEDLVNKLDK